MRTQSPLGTAHALRLHSTCGVVMIIEFLTCAIDGQAHTNVVEMVANATSDVDVGIAETAER